MTIGAAIHRPSVAARCFWGTGLAFAAAALYLAVQPMPLLGTLDLIWAWRTPPAAVADEGASPPAMTEPSHVYFLRYADSGQALILYNHSLIVVHRGDPLPDGSRLAELSPDRLVTTEGRTLEIQRW